MTALPGVYRGVCVDNRDPEGLGRIRVKVPQILADATGWALPAWPLHDWTIIPDDRVPGIGMGVWVVFEGEDRLTWIATYGAQEWPVPDENGLYVPVLEWDLRTLPTGVAKKVSGSLLSDAGVPQPDPVVVMEKSQNGVTDWQPVGSGEVDAEGKWSVVYVRPDGEVDWWYRAVFEGTEPFVDAATEPAQISAATLSVLMWNAPVTEWMRPKTVSGMLQNGADAPIAGADIVLQTRTAGDWQDVGTATTETDGGWSLEFLRTIIDRFELRAFYGGNDVQDVDATDPVVQPETLEPVVLAWTVPAGWKYGVRVTISGTLSSSYGPPFQKTVAIEADPGNGWRQVTTAPVGSDGSWSVSYLPNTLLKASYRASVAASPPFLAAVSTTEARTVETTTTTLVASLPSLVTVGFAFVVTGRVDDQGSKPVTEGTVVLQQKYGSGAWTDVKSATVAANGTWTITHPGPPTPGPVSFRVSYSGVGTGYLLPSTSATVDRTAAPATTTITTSTAASHSSCSFTWTAVPGAAGYEVQRRWVHPSNPNFTSEFVTTGTSFTWTGMAEDNAYAFKVRPYANDASGNRVYGAFSNLVTYNTGHAERRSIRDRTWYEALTTGTNSWRSTDGWSWGGDNDEVKQGYYNSASSDWTGVMTYDGAAFQAYVKSIADDPDTVLANIVFENTFVRMKRNNSSGNGGDHQIRWFVTNSVVNQGGQPSLAGGDDRGPFFALNNASLDNPASEGWCELQAHWGKHVLLNEWLPYYNDYTRSFAIKWTGTARYMSFLGKNDNSKNCRMHVYFSWNYVWRTFSAYRWS